MKNFEMPEMNIEELFVTDVITTSICASKTEEEEI